MANVLDITQWYYFNTSEEKAYHSNDGHGLHLIRSYARALDNKTPDGTKELLEYIDDYRFEEWDFESENGNRRFTFLYDIENRLLYPILMVEHTEGMPTCYYFDEEFRICRLINMLRYKQQCHRNFEESRISHFVMNEKMSNRLELETGLWESDHDFKTMVVNNSIEFRMVSLKYS